MLLNLKKSPNQTWNEIWKHHRIRTIKCLSNFWSLFLRNLLWIYLSDSVNLTLDCSLDFYFLMRKVSQLADQDFKTLSYNMPVFILLISAISCPFLIRCEKMNCLVLIYFAQHKLSLLSSSQLKWNVWAYVSFPENCIL